MISSSSSSSYHQQQQGGIGKFLAQQKRPFYQFTNQLVNNQFNKYLYALMIVIQHLQILGFQCYTVYHHKGWGVNVFTELVNFLNPQYYIKYHNLMDYYIPISFFINLVHIVIFCYTYYQHKEKGTKKDVVQIKSHNMMVLVHYFNVISCTVYTIPTALSSLLIFYCHPSSPYHPNRDCYDTYHLFLIFMGLVNILWILVINIYYFMLYYVDNPFKFSNVLSLSSSLWNLLKFTIKIAPIGYLIFDQKLQYFILYVFGICAGLVGYAGISRIIYPYTRYNLSIERIMITIEIVSIFSSISFILQAFFTEPQGVDITFVVSFIISIPLARLAYFVNIENKKKMVLKINQYQKENKQEIQKVLKYLIVDLKDQQIVNNSSSKKRFFKIIKFHNDKCENLQCKCHEYLKNFRQNDNYYQDKAIILKIFIQIIDKIAATDRKPYSLLILKAFIQYYQLNNTIKAAFIISKVMKQKISLFDEYRISGFLYQISKSFQDTSNMEKYRLFSQHLIKFQKETIKLAQLYEQFWHQIIEQNSSLLKVMNLMKKTKMSKQLIDENFQNLYNLFPTNIRITEIYKEVYKQILIDYDAFMKFQSIYKDNIQQKQQSKLIRLQHQMNFSANQDLIVINTSVNVTNDIFRGGCQIISVTNNVYKILGYSSQDLIGKNINRFLPKIYTQFHDEYINNYLNRNDNELKSRQLLIYPINSNGYLVECAMYNKVMPSLQHGANIVSFLLNSKLSKQNLIIYDQRTGLIDSMSQKAENLLLGKKTKSSSITIPDHISDILPVWDYIKEQMNQSKKKTAQQINSSYSDVYLYRSDGPQNNKYVKIVSFQVTFQSKIFTMNECISQNQNFWLGFQTLIQNSPNKQKITQEQKKQVMKETNQKQIIEESPVQILHSPSKSGLKQNVIQHRKLFTSLPQHYPKIYYIVQIIILVSLCGQILYNYISTIQYYKVLQNDIVIKQNVEDALALMLYSSHSASQYLFSGNNALLKNNTVPQQQIQNLKELMGIGQYIYQQIIKKERNNQIMVSDLMIEVKYFSSGPTLIIKQQTVTDASYQYVLYLIEIYKNLNPLSNLPYNILFVFKNCISISDELENLNNIFTQNLIKNGQKRKSETIVLIATILMLFSISLIWETIYKIMIFLKIKRVIQIYQSIPISELQKFPKKCQNFVRYVSPVQTAKKAMIVNTIKSINDLGNVLNKANHRQSVNQMDPLVDEEQQIQYVQFSNKSSVIQIIILSFCFLIAFSIFYIVSISSQNQLLIKNQNQIKDWNSMVRFKSQLLQTVYFLNQYKNYGNQWNQSERTQSAKRFNESIQKISYLLKSTQRLNQYLSWTYRIVQSSIHIINNPKITVEQQLINEQKVKQLAQQIQQTQIDLQIQQGMQKTINSFKKMMQLILVGQIIIFLVYGIIYVPKSYRNYLQKKELIQLMYKTLGYKLQNIAKKNLMKVQ